MAMVTSRTDRSTRAGTTAASCSANRSRVWLSRLAAMASTCPPDNTPSRHAWGVTVRRASLRARAALAAARERAMPPIRQPAGHRGRPLEFPQRGGVVGGDGVADAGLQPVPQSDRGGEGVAVERDVERLDGGPQLFEHAHYRTRVRPSVQAIIPA